MAIGLLLVGGAALAGCTPGPIPLVYGQPIASAPSGFTGSTSFACGGSLYLNITGSGGGSITVTPTGLGPFTATGGPLAYQSAEAGYRIEFQPGYASLALISLRGAPPEPCRA
jgi:hypothetical protein